MKPQKIRGKDLEKIGLTDTRASTLALQAMRKYSRKNRQANVLKLVKKVLQEPKAYLNDRYFGSLAQYLCRPEPEEIKMDQRDVPPFAVFGEGNISEQAKHQMYTAMKLPVTVDGALMPDSHYGYGLPIGGVLATDNAVIPYGVGVDIGCRMCLSIYRDDPQIVETRKDELKHVLRSHTRFGLKERFERPNEAEVLDRDLFREIPMLKNLQTKAYEQLGSSGGGNHFVEFGVVNIPEDSN